MFSTRKESRRREWTSSEEGGQTQRKEREKGENGD